MLFQDILDVAVDRQHKRVSVRCRNVLLIIIRHILVFGILRTDDAPCSTGKLALVFGFQAVNAHVIVVDIAQHGGKESAVFVIPLGVRLGIDRVAAARGLELFIQGVFRVLIYLLGDDLILGIGSFDFPQHGVVVQLQRVGKDLRQLLLLLFRRYPLVHLGLVDHSLGIDRNAGD